MEHTRFEGDNRAWMAFVWASWLIAMGTTMTGLVYMPGDLWVRGFMGIGLLFSVATSFTLAKTVRDQHESRRLHHLLRESRLMRELAIEEELGEPRRAA